MVDFSIVEKQAHGYHIYLQVSSTDKFHLQSPGLHAIGKLLFIARLLLGDRTAMKHSSLN
jgi:hypothetical protein